MSFGSVMKNIGKVGGHIVLEQVGGETAARQFDAITRDVTESKADKDEQRAILQRLDFIKSTPIPVASEEPPSPVGLMDSKRVKMAFVAMTYIIVVNVLVKVSLLDQGTANYIAALCGAITGLQQVLETLRPSGQARRDL